MLCIKELSYIFVIGEYWPQTIFNLTLSQILAENFYEEILGHDIVRQFYNIFEDLT